MFGACLLQGYSTKDHPRESANRPIPNKAVKKTVADVCYNCIMVCTHICGYMRVACNACERNFHYLGNF